MHDLLTTAEAAQVLDTSERMVHYLVREKRLTPAKKIGRINLFDPMAVALLKPTLVRRNWSQQAAKANEVAA